MRSTLLPSFKLPSTTPPSARTLSASLGDPTPIAAAAGFSIDALVDDMKRITNIANAQHSTGPKTPEGKARSSQNALRHGAFAQSTLIPTDDPETFEAFRLDFLKTFSPQNTPERFLTQRLISVAWRLQRITQATAEFNCADDFLASIEELDRLSKVEDRLQSMFQRAQKQLQQLQKDRRESPPQEGPFLNEQIPQNKPTPPREESSTPAQVAPKVACIVAPSKNAQNEPTASPAQSDPKVACIVAPPENAQNQPTVPLPEKSAQRTQLPEPGPHAPHSPVAHDPARTGSLHP